MRRRVRIAVLVAATVLICSPSARTSTYADGPGEGEDEVGLDLETLDVEALEPLLAKGELTLIESEDDGELKFVTVLGMIDAPAERVLEVITDYDAYTEFVPRAKRVRVLKREADELEIEFNVEVPGPNYIYVQRHTIDRKALRIEVETIRGHLKGGRFRYHLRRHGRQTLLAYGLKAELGMMGILVKPFDDRHHTMDYAINVSAGVLIVRAMKEEAERREAENPSPDTTPREGDDESPH